MVKSFVLKNIYLILKKYQAKTRLTINLKNEKKKLKDMECNMLKNCQIPKN